MGLPTQCHGTGHCNQRTRKRPRGGGQSEWVVFTDWFGPARAEPPISNVRRLAPGNTWILGNRSVATSTLFSLISHHLPSLCDMRNFIPLPKSNCRARSEARGELAPIEDPINPNPVTLRPTELVPNIGFGYSDWPTFGPVASHDQDSGGMQTIFFQMIHLTAPFHLSQIATSLLILSDPYP